MKLHTHTGRNARHKWLGHMSYIKGNLRAHLNVLHISGQGLIEHFVQCTTQPDSLFEDPPVVGSIDPLGDIFGAAALCCRGSDGARCIVEDGH